MKDIILWIFSQIATFIETSMTWKIYGDFSLTHFILASLFLLALFGLFGFATHNFGSGVENIAIGFKNAENKKDKQNYYKFSATATRNHRINGNNYSMSETRDYKLNKKTGHITEVDRSYKLKGSKRV